MPDIEDPKTPPQTPPPPATPPANGNALAPPPAAGAAGGGDPPGLSIVPVAIEDEMRKSYLDYSMSVIIGRALPDVRDGLKPVHRRVLFAMHDLGNYHNKAYKKSARIVGDVIGKYHPHGDVAVYDTLVRMAQDFSMRYMLVDGQGNFGSIDGDPPAAMRYTESRLTRLAEEMLADIDKETVDFGPNYDDSLVEPLVMPNRFPNLLVNGSSGIAVGMATNIPPHNMGETIDATIHLIENPKATIPELMHFMPGPDFPTAGFIQGRQGIYDAYTTGRGHLKMRAKAEIEVDPKNEKETIVVTELPYQVNKARLIESIAELHRDKVVEGITALRDESDRTGMRIVVEVSRNVMGQVVLNNLFAHTDLQTTFGVIMLGIDAGQPRILTLRELLERFISHRKDVVTRRTRFELRKAEARLHIVEGLMVAQDFIDHVISLIRKSKDPEEANWGLQHVLSPELWEHKAFKDLARIDVKAAQAQMDKLVARLKGEESLYKGLTRTYAGTGFSPEQAKAILEMRLQKLTGLEREELIKELLQLSRDIARYNEILSNEKVLFDVIKAELREVRDRYADARRTQIVEDTSDMSVEDLITREDVVVTLSHTGYVKRNPVTDYRAQKRGGRGKTGAVTKEDDFVEQVFVASTHDYLLVFSTRGRLYWLKVHELPNAGRNARGKAIINLVQFGTDEKLAAMLTVSNFESGRFVAFVTKKGIVKRTDIEQFSNPRPSGIIALGIEDGDALVAALLTDNSKDLLLSTKQGMSIRFREDEVRVMGRGAYGVKGITLEDDDEVVAAEVIEPSKTLLTVTENGYGKRTEESEYRVQGRGGKGIIDIKTTDRNGSVIGVLQVTEKDEIMLITNKGMLIRTRVKEVSVIGRNTQGVRLITLESADEKVSGIARLPEASEEDEAVAAAAAAAAAAPGVAAKPEEGGGNGATNAEAPAPEKPADSEAKPDKAPDGGKEPKA
ncbi:MAG TPA: DNA gyrase subunit A [Myxococcales bacterium]|jgi:DNA gyrase subunit A